MFFGMLTIDNDGFSMVLGLSNHWFQWFSMVKDHWSNDGMVSMDRTGLNQGLKLKLNQEPAKRQDPGMDQLP